MYWVLAAIVVFITLAVPRLRPIGIAGCVILGLMLLWGVVQRWQSPDTSAPTVERGRPTTPAATLQAMDIEAIDASNLKLSGSGAPYVLAGTIANRAREQRLKSVTILATRRDCYEGALDPSGCVILWQDRHWVDVTVPPGEQRDFSVSIWSRGAAPRPRGDIRDEFQLVAATGETLPR
jgi:hypothetical protein